MSERYYIDERVGCVAVRDRLLDGPDSSGHLDSDTDGVVQYWHGVRMDGGTCEHCKRPFEKVWGISPEDLESAKLLCIQLNSLKQTEPGGEMDCQRRADFGPNGDATTPGFFKQTEGGGENG